MLRTFVSTCNFHFFFATKCDNYIDTKIYQRRKFKWQWKKLFQNTQIKKLQYFLDFFVIDKIIPVGKESVHSFNEWSQDIWNGLVPLTQL